MMQQVRSLRILKLWQFSNPFKIPYLQEKTPRVSECLLNEDIEDFTGQIPSHMANVYLWFL